MDARATVAIWVSDAGGEALRVGRIVRVVRGLLGEAGEYLGGEWGIGGLTRREGSRGLDNLT